MKTELSLTFLEKFYKTQEPFALIQGSLYEMHPVNNGKNPRNSLKYLDSVVLELVESESFRILEKEFFIENHSLIQEIISQAIQSLKKRTDNVRGEVVSLQNLLQEHMNNSIEYFLKREIFEAYQSKYSAKATTSQRIKGILNEGIYSDININQFSIDDIIGQKTSVLSRVLQKKDVVVWMDYLFILESTKNDVLQSIQLKGKKYYLCPYLDLDTLIRAYREALLKEINTHVQKNISQYDKMIADTQKRKLELQSLKQEVDSINSTKLIDNVHHTILGIKKESETRYEVYIQLLPYILKKNGNKYLFDSVTCHTYIEINNNRVKLTGKPTIKTPNNYHHPFVFADNSICYNEKIDRFYQEGVTWDYISLVNPKDRAYAANNIATALNISRKVLQMGYRGNTIKPVNPLDITNFREEYKKALTCSHPNIKVYEN
jgi:hypothetical protein